MIRNALFGISMLTLTAGSAFAATAKHPVAKSHTVAQSDSATPAADKPAKKTTKKSTKKSSTKTDAAKGDSGKEMKAPAPEAK